MELMRCKMCGGDLRIDSQQGFGTCEYCGSTMTLPKATDERVANLYNRANHHRLQHDFDKALSAYENILNEAPDDAEAHWGVVLCRYGIEYVEDPVSHDRVPTCHRVQFGSLLNDADYLAALEHAGDSYVRSLYQREAGRIAEVQKGILAVSNREKPYDVFICYKENTESGTRTLDSTLAQDIYYHLTQDGYRVFFARITLEDKLGREYEPYIFAALNSAKVMVVVGTRPEHFNAVWVRNEWSRFLAIMSKDRSRLLIPCYKDMNPYDLPEELSMLQSQDMGKIGFIQDLVRGIRKIVDAGRLKDNTVTVPNGPEVVASRNAINPLLERAFIFLEDGKTDKAQEYLERVLDQEPKCARAYLGKFLAENRCTGVEQLLEQAEDDWFEKSGDYRKAVSFAQGAERNEIEGYRLRVHERIEKEREAERIRLEQEEQERLRMEEAERIRLQQKKAERLRREEAERVVREQEEAERLRIAEIDRIKRELEERIDKEKEKKRRKVFFIILPIIIVLVILLEISFKDSYLYSKAEKLMESGNRIGAYTLFKSLGDYRDAYKRFENLAMVEVRLDPQGGKLSEESAVIVVKYEQGYGALPDPFKEGYVFAGWWTSSGSAGRAVTNDTLVGTMNNHVLYAKWVSMLMIFVEGGAFQMGSTSGDSDEKPVHSVTVGSFYMGPYEVTQDIYEQVMGSNPSNFKGARQPVEQVTWYDAVAFANALSRRDGFAEVYTISGTSVSCDWSKRGYRLPTEAEWEYAARGGSKSQDYTYAGSNTIEDVAWYTSNSGSKTHEVGGKRANELGLYDMTGNVWEWCWDWYGDYSASPATNPRGPSSGSYRVLRGGSWSYNASYARPAIRNNLTPSNRGSYGFRLVLPAD